MVKTLVVSNDKKQLELTKKYFAGNKKIEITKIVNTGIEAINELVEKQNKFDVVLLDLIMPNKDGIDVLKELKLNNIEQKVIITSPVESNELIAKSFELGASYFIIKPIILDNLEDKILDLTTKHNQLKLVTDDKKHKTYESVTKILHELGIPSNIKGYLYLREGINLVYNDPKLIGSVTKELYPEIGKKYKEPVARIERAIRHAIEVSWNRGSWELMTEIFGHSVDIEKAKPTNSEFIVTIADKLKIDAYEYI